MSVGCLFGSVATYPDSPILTRNSTGELRTALDARLDGVSDKVLFIGEDSLRFSLSPAQDRPALADPVPCSGIVSGGSLRHARRVDRDDKVSIACCAITSARPTQSIHTPEGVDS